MKFDYYTFKKYVLCPVCLVCSCFDHQPASTLATVVNLAILKIPCSLIESSRLDFSPLKHPWEASGVLLGLCCASIGLSDVYHISYTCSSNVAI